ncbi:UNKNOWN [Stylonychia lemnae]|uniref:Uncharacterized protein n=1 Tax=Stylonychia lemnae TaxID=5949 RepID=A0A078A929_STYLE|nr:UNKNOWN [Stylonychia lemnae]|eukprot:CDW78062.1 UNKNOWN [Stylonychia lemnae]
MEKFRNNLIIFGLCTLTFVNAYYYEKRTLSDTVQLTMNSPSINFHQYYSEFSEIQNINKIIISSYKQKESDTSCNSAPKNSYCQEYNLQQVPFVTLNQTIKNCMEDAYLYIIPNEATSQDDQAAIKIHLNLLSEDKSCNGFLNSDQLMQCTPFKASACLNIIECSMACGVLECWRGEELSPFTELTIPIDLTNDYAKNLCTFYNNILKFESAQPTLKPYQTFILSIFLVLVMVITLLAIYYNVFLAYRNRPPFRVVRFCPHILFPRGERGLGKHNVDPDGDNSSFIGSRNYKSLAGSSKTLPNQKIN